MQRNVIELKAGAEQKYAISPTNSQSQANANLMSCLVKWKQNNPERQVGQSVKAVCGAVYNLWQNIVAAQRSGLNFSPCPSLDHNYASI